MTKCSACGKFLRSTGGAECVICPRAFHKACIGLMDVDVVEKGWSCPECKRTQPKGDNSNTPVKSNTMSQPLTKSKLTPEGSLPKTHALLPPLNSPVPDNHSNSEMRLIRQDLAEYMKELRDFREEFRSFRSSMGERIDGLENRLTALEQRDLPTREELVQMQMTVDALKMDINDRDQETLLSDLDIGHLPEVNGENVTHTVTVLAAKLGVTVEERDIVFAERVGRADSKDVPAQSGALSGRPRRVVVRLARRSLRDQILQAARVRRTLSSSECGLAGTPRRIYFNERLTKVNRQLFHQVREECRKRGWRYAWTKQGRVFARQEDGKQVLYIRSAAALDRVFNVKTV